MCKDLKLQRRRRYDIYLHWLINYLRIGISLLHQQPERVEGETAYSLTTKTDAEGMRDIIDTDKTTFSARPAAELEIIIKNWK